MGGLTGSAACTAMRVDAGDARAAAEFDGAARSETTAAQVGGGGSERVLGRIREWAAAKVDRREREFRERVQSRTTGGGMTPGQQALLAARQRMQISRTIEETQQVRVRIRV